MSFSHFLYRQKQKLKYHFASDDVTKQIAEINRFELRVIVSRNSYSISELDLILPKNLCDYVFQRFDLLVSNSENLNGAYNIENGKLYFSWENFTVHISSVSELFIINEIFVEQCYNFQFSKDITKAVVIDIGLNVGLAALYFASKESVEFVYGFEPFKPTYDKAITNLLLNGNLNKSIVPYNYGLGMGFKKLKVPYCEKNSGINSSLIENESNLELGTHETIQINDVYEELERIIRNHKGNLIVIKMDTEGAEFEIFERLVQEKIWPNVKIFMIEWHFKRPFRIEDYLIRQKFALISTVLNKNAGLIYAFR